MADVWTDIATRSTADANASADINSLMANCTIAAPYGAIMEFGADTAPDGWFLCDGSAISRTTYSDLFAVISTDYGVGDGTTTFNIPNTQGIFLRGVGTQTIGGRAKGGGSIADVNEDIFQGHRQDKINGGGVIYDLTNAGGAIDYVGGGAKLINADTFTGSPVTDTTNGTPRTGATTEPSSLDVEFIIKY